MQPRHRKRNSAKPAICCVSCTASSCSHTPFDPAPVVPPISPFLEETLPTWVSSGPFQHNRMKVSGNVLERESRQEDYPKVIGGAALFRHKVLKCRNLERWFRSDVWLHAFRVAVQLSRVRSLYQKPRLVNSEQPVVVNSLLVTLGSCFPRPWQSIRFLAGWQSIAPGPVGS